MADVKLNVLFKKMQKDDKKEVLLYHVQDSTLPFLDEILKMVGGIAIITVEESEAGEVGAEFVNVSCDDKKTVLKFHIKGGKGSKVDMLYPFAGSHVSLIIKPSQMTIDEFYEGTEYTVGQDGTVEVIPGQMEIADVEETEVH